MLDSLGAVLGIRLNEIYLSIKYFDKTDVCRGRVDDWGLTSLCHLHLGPAHHQCSQILDPKEGQFISSSSWNSPQWDKSFYHILWPNWFVQRLCGQLWPYFTEGGIACTRDKHITSASKSYTLKKGNSIAAVLGIHLYEIYLSITYFDWAELCRGCVDNHGLTWLKVESSALGARTLPVQPNPKPWRWAIH